MPSSIRNLTENICRWARDFVNSNKSLCRFIANILGKFSQRKQERGSCVPGLSTVIIKEGKAVCDAGMRRRRTDVELFLLNMLDISL